MIEEAAGTRMYECKKISAQKTIEKKEAKLKEIQTVRQMRSNPNDSTSLSVLYGLGLPPTKDFLCRLLVAIWSR